MVLQFAKKRNLAVVWNSTRLSIADFNVLKELKARNIWQLGCLKWLN
jgi:hypothetical protein